MEHVLVKAATTATDRGEFTAVISTVSVDREKDIIEPAAMVASLAKWAALGKLVPLAWNHTDEVIGHIDPATVEIAGGEVIAKGFIDQSVDRGVEAWRLVKSGTLSFSFGFLFDPKTGASKLVSGGYRIKELDVFEISVIPIAPANNDTRVLNWKAMSPADLASRMSALADELDANNPDMAKQMRAMSEEMAMTGKALDDALTAQKAAEQQLEALDEGHETDEAGKEPVVRPVDPLKETAMKAALGVLTGNAQPPLVTKEQPSRVPDMSPEDLRRHSRDLIWNVLTGIEVT